jgi:uncharacterized membrane protein
VNFAHLHLLLNHVPTVGTVVALGLLLLAFTRRNEHLKIAGLEVLFVIALLTVPAFMTGTAAHRELRQVSGVSDSTMRAHQDAALWGLTVMEAAGFAAWLALWQIRRRGRAAKGLVSAAMVLMVVALAMMAGAAKLGGEIRHPEVGASVPVTPPEQFVAMKISRYLTNESPWAWPAGEAVHFLGMSLSLGVLLAVNLRILGAMRQVPFEAVHRLLPWGMLGFGLNLITGMLFFVGQPGQYIQNTPFYWKVGFLMIAGANFLYLTVFKRAWAPDGFVPTIGDKAMAAISLVAWLGILYAGRMLPFLGNAF